MNDSRRTKGELIQELQKARVRLSELEKSEKRHRMLVEKVQDMIFTIDLMTGFITSANSFAERTLGYERKDILNNAHFLEFAHPDDRERVFKAFQERVFEGKMPPDIQFRVLKKNGDSIYVEEKGTELYDDEGNISAYLTVLRDITERKLAEERLKKSQERYKTLVDNSLTAICIIQDLKFRFVNRRFIEISGYPSEELLGRYALDLVHPEDKKIALEAAAKRLAGQDREEHYQYRVITKNGETRWIETLGTAVEYQGKPAILANLNDITHHKLADEALKQSEERYRMVVEEARDIICTIDMKTGIITGANSYGEMALGYDRDNVVNKVGFIDLVHPDDREVLLDRLQKLAFQGIRKPNFPFRLRKADGSYIEVEINGAVINDPEGSPQTYIGVIRDITERKRAEEIVRESEEKYRTLFEESRDIIFITSPEGRFLDINPVGLELFGFSSKEELSQVDIAQDLYLDPNEREVFGRKIAQHGFVKDYEMVMKRWGRDGEHMTLLVTASAVRDSEGNILAFRGIARDVTEQKRLEQQLLQAQKMESIGTLAGGIAHDFNNILGGILGYASFMKTKIARDHPFFSYVDTIESSAERAADLTAQLLAFARGGKYETKPVNLNLIVEDTLKILDRTLDKSIEIRTHFEASLPTVEADSGQMQQLLMNLCVNANDAMPGGGQLIIETNKTEIEGAGSGINADSAATSYVTLSVTDTGVGMDREIVKRIFEPFYTTKTQGKGTGLGLSMVYGVVKNHGGFVNVYSEPGIGSTFKVYLPASTKPYAEELPDNEMPPEGNELVLVVDDEASIRSVARDMLETHGYRVLVAEDGEQAVEIYKQHNGNIKLVILDMVMPKMGGHETFTQLKKLNPDVRAVLSTGYSQNGKAQEIIDSGVMGFVQKPYRVGTLLSRVRSVLDEKAS